MLFDVDKLIHQAPAGEVSEHSPRSSHQLVTITDQNIPTVSEGATPRITAREVKRSTLQNLTESEPTDSGDLDDNDLDDEPSPANVSHGEQYLITPSGLPTIYEYFSKAGIAANSAARNWPAVLPLYNHSGEVEDTTHLVRGGCRKMVEVTTRTGAKLVMPSKHRILVMQNGWWVALTFGEVNSGDCIMMQRSLEGWIGTPSEYSLGVISLLGVTVADGYCGPNRVSLSNDDPKIQALILEFGPELFGFDPLIYKKAGSTGSIAYQFNRKKRIVEIYARLGWKPCKAAGKQLGPFIRSLDTEGMRAFLQGYVDCECTITDEG